MSTLYTVRAGWDPEASVWVATSDDVPGLVTEADTIDALAAKLRGMVPELLELKGVLPAPVGDVPIELVTRLPPAARWRTLGRSCASYCARTGASSSARARATTRSGTART